MSNISKISIIMPAYNVEKYIGKAIESVLNQTFIDWELIIINDCSTDNTVGVISSFNDNRIILVDRKENSGSAYLPRYDGIMKAQGEWIVNLDADDFIENSYLEKAFNKVKENNLDVCTAQMFLVNENGANKTLLLPQDDIYFNKIFNGDEALGLTVPIWKISMNGALTKKELWEKALKLYDFPGKRVMHDDENLSRILLMEAKRISSVKASYFFRCNPNSVTRKFSINTFSWSKSNSDLLRIVEKKYDNYSSEYCDVFLYDYYCYKSVFCDFIRNANDKQTVEKGLPLLKKWHNQINWDKVCLMEGNLKSKIFRKMSLSLFVLSLKYHNIKFIIYMMGKVFNKILLSIKSNKYYAWYITRKKREKKIRNSLKNYYTGRSNPTDYKPNVICIYDGAVEAGGFADRLKGIISTFYIAKCKNIPFKIYFKKPFPLEDYFVPNLYDWTINQSEICKNYDGIELVILDNTQDSAYQIAKQKKYLQNKIKKTNRQIHSYTNASFSYDLNYAGLFKELFKPSLRLQTSIDEQLRAIGKEYVSISCRFMDLLGDFNETHGVGNVLSESEKNSLLVKIRDVINNIHKNHPDKKILVNSDSITFLNMYEKCEYTYIVPGNITHIDAMQSGYSYEKFEKTLLDFMMIANADVVYLIKSELMYKSGYPFAASKLYGKPFEIIEI